MKIGELAASVEAFGKKSISLGQRHLERQQAGLTVSAWSIVALDESHIDGIVSIEKDIFQATLAAYILFERTCLPGCLDVVVLNPGHGQIIAYACLRLTLDETCIC